MTEREVLFTEAECDGLEDDTVLLPMEWILTFDLPKWVIDKQCCHASFDYLVDHFPQFADFIIKSCKRRGVHIPTTLNYEFHLKEQLPLEVPQYCRPPHGEIEEVLQ